MLQDAACITARMSCGRLRCASDERILLYQPRDRMLTLIENGEVYSPAPCGRRSVLLVEDRIDRAGEADAGAIEKVRVIAGGQTMVRDGELVAREHFLEKSNRKGELHGTKD